MYLLDTDVLIWILRGNPDVVEWVAGIKDKTAVSISVMSIAEIYKNILPMELAATEDLFNKHIIFDVDQKIVKMAGLYWQHYRKKIKTISLIDCLVAATANVYDLTLASFNIKHFPMSDIRLIKPGSIV